MLLFDASQHFWGQLRAASETSQDQDEKSLGKTQFVQQLLLFLNTYLMLQDENRLAAFAVDGEGRCASPELAASTTRQALLIPCF